MTTFPLRVAGLSWQIRLRGVAVTLGGLVLLGLLMALNMRLGDIRMTVAEVLGGTFDVNSANHFVIMELRLPRALTGALVGAALALSGAIIQSIARNPLASPEILGVTTGASVTVVAGVVASGSAVGGASGLLSTLGIPVLASLPETRS